MPVRGYPHRRLLACLRRMSPVEAQNRLLPIGDTDLATALLYMADADRNRVLSLVGSGKALRVSDALRRLETTRVDYAYYCAAVERVEAALAGAPAAPIRSYYRPSGGGRHEPHR